MFCAVAIKNSHGLDLVLALSEAPKSEYFPPVQQAKVPEQLAAIHPEEGNEVEPEIE